MRASAAPGGNIGDLDYFGRTLTDNLNGTFALNAEFQVNDTRDNSCNVGYPGGVLTGGNGTGTTADICPGSQPAGFCFDSQGAGGYGRCDFSDCGSSETNNTRVDSPCQCPVDPTVDVNMDGVPDGVLTSCRGNRGRPKYGDYNGNACVGGRLYAAWAQGDPTATTPPPDANGDTFLDGSNDVDILFKCSTNPNDTTQPRTLTSRHQSSTRARCPGQ
jgi:hypothetical protein